MVEFKISLTFLVIILTLVYGRTAHNPCTSSFDIPCDNGQCISSYGWCDAFSTIDCDDGSDEKYCQSGVRYNCTDKHFACNDGKCIPLVLRCNRWNECANADDEENCNESDKPNYTSEKEPENSPSSIATTELYRNIHTTTEYYQGRNLDQSNNHERNNVYSSRPRSVHTPSPLHSVYYTPAPTSPVNRNRIDHTVRNHPQNNRGSNSAVDYNAWNYDPLNAGSNNVHNSPQNRGHDTHPRRNILTNQNTAQRLPNRQIRTIDRQDATRSDVHGSRTVVNPPRSILYPQSSNSRSPDIPRPNYSHFYFSENYTRDFGNEFQHNVEDAKAWLLSQRDKTSYNWGRDTSRALIALSLISNSFKSDESDNELMKKSLQMHLGIKILKNSTGVEKIGTTTLAMYINALLATCQNPRDFLGLDLVGDLYYRQYRLERKKKFVNPIIFLTLCLTDMPVNVDHLSGYLVRSFPLQISKDLHILAMTAMACISQKNPHDEVIRWKLNEAIQSLLAEINSNDGSFGSKYSTALAAQALMSVNGASWYSESGKTMSWHSESRKTMSFLARQQREDGSFGDMQSTYYSLLALSGRSLVHLRNTLCDPLVVKKEWSPEDILNREGDRKSVLYTLKTDNSGRFSAGIRLSVPLDTNFYDIMRIAAYQDPRFKFNYEITNDQLGVHTIANIPNDPERGMFWTLYHAIPASPSAAHISLDRYTGDIKSLIPNHLDEFIFWYTSEF